MITWAGMRGIVSLAAAMALSPAFPYRDLIVLTAFSVILGTLALQGLTLKPLAFTDPAQWSYSCLIGNCPSARSWRLRKSRNLASGHDWSPAPVLHRGDVLSHGMTASLSASLLLAGSLHGSKPVLG